MNRRILIAMGGNAIKQANEKGTTEEQVRNCELTARIIVDLMETLGEDDRIAITHGNGPQSGNLLVQQEEAQGIVPAQDMDIVGAMTQGQIGYMLMRTLQNEFRRCNDWRNEIGVEGKVVAIVNQVLVDINDKDFLDPSKPVGDFFTKEQADVFVRDNGYVLNPPAGKEYLDKKVSGHVIKQVKPLESTDRPYRRVVPSPDPIKNIESKAIKQMVDLGYLVIASGGGGVPVILEKEGLKGVFAVVDKDLAGERMAEAIEANEFYIFTDIDRVKLNFHKPNEKSIDRMSLSEARGYLEEGHFLPGSMLTKVKACIRFLEGGSGKKAFIGKLSKAKDVLYGKGGTEIYKD